MSKPYIHHVYKLTENETPGEFIKTIKYKKKFLDWALDYILITEERICFRLEDEEKFREPVLIMKSSKNDGKKPGLVFVEVLWNPEPPNYEQICKITSDVVKYSGCFWELNVAPVCELRNLILSHIIEQFSRKYNKKQIKKIPDNVKHVLSLMNAAGYLTHFLLNSTERIDFMPFAYSKVPCRIFQDVMKNIFEFYDDFEHFEHLQAYQKICKGFDSVDIYWAEVEDDKIAGMISDYAVKMFLSGFCTRDGIIEYLKNRNGDSNGFKENL
jgi:hypothetical protein